LPLKVPTPTNFYNLLSDASFINQIPDATLRANVQQLSEFVANLSTTYPGAHITLTVHSLGGVLAEIVGKAGNIYAVGFDAPGGANLISQLTAETHAVAVRAVLSPGASQVTYRLNGDQISLVGAPIGAVFTVPNPAGSDLKSWLFLTYHDADTLANQLYLQVVANPGATGPNWLADIQFGTNLACSNFATQCSLTRFGVQIIENDLGSLARLFDPPPGFDYFFEMTADSPPLASIGLPELGPVNAWRLRYRIAGEWSTDQTIFPEISSTSPSGSMNSNSSRSMRLEIQPTTPTRSPIS